MGLFGASDRSSSESKIGPLQRDRKTAGGGPACVCSCTPAAKVTGGLDEVPETVEGAELGVLDIFRIVADTFCWAWLLTDTVRGFSSSRFLGDAVVDGRCDGKVCKWFWS